MENSGNLSLSGMQGHSTGGGRESSHGDDKSNIDLVQGSLGPQTLSLLGQTLSFNGQGPDVTNQSAFSLGSQGFQGLPRGVDMGRPLGYNPEQQVDALNFSQQMGRQNNNLGNLPSVNPNGLQGTSSTQALMNSLNLLQQNIGALQALVPLISQSNPQVGSGLQPQHLQQQQAAASAGVAAVISQLAVAAAGILPQVNGGLGQQGMQNFQRPTVGNQQGQGLLGSVADGAFAQFGGNNQINHNGAGFNVGGQVNIPQGNVLVDVEKNDDADGYVETLPEGSYDVVEMDPVEILAEHTHFCEICGKGFKRDANLRMHMRGHGDEYKTPAALSRPDKHIQDLASTRPKRYSCPYVGCKRNKKHKKFQPLKTMLCVKNHYRRSHCPKMLTCSKCNAKRFSVVADLKTHEKHCGRDKWMCSCRTTFSRKDKLLGHLSLFAGHTPAMPLHVMEEGINNSGGSASVQVTTAATAATSGDDGNSSQHNDNKLQDLSGLRQLSSASEQNSPGSTPFGQILGSSNLFNSSSLLQGLFTTNFLDNNGGLR